MQAPEPVAAIIKIDLHGAALSVQTSGISVMRMVPLPPNTLYTQKNQYISPLTQKVAYTETKRK